MLKPPAPRAEIAHRLDIAIGGQQLGAHLEAIRADDHVDRARRASARSEFLAVGARGTSSKSSLRRGVPARAPPPIAPAPITTTRPGAAARAALLQPVLRAAPNGPHGGLTVPIAGMSIRALEQCPGIADIAWTNDPVEP
jgi:hypothetical protein